MVRTFLKHCEEAGEDDELRVVYRRLYDFMMALGGPVAASGPESYLKMARKKRRKLREALELFVEIQPEISSHTNFQMAVQSLTTAVGEIEGLLEQAATDPGSPAPGSTEPAPGKPGSHPD